MGANKLERNRVLIVSGSFGVLMTILNLSAFGAAIFATQFHLASVGIVYLVISYTLSVVSQLWSATHATRMYVRIVGDASPMIATLQEPVEIKDAPVVATANMHDGAVAFHNLTFTHDESNKPLFRDFSLAIPAGQRVGLVGHSGSGKTSLTRLLLRFSDVDAGEITIDSQNIATLAQDDVRRAISYVPQEPLLFHRTLRDNIAYGKPDATDQEVWQAARAAHADDFINELPDKVETIVGERGVKLSGGQRQRIAIARAILKDAPILVLDEATSALDSESEKLIQASLETLMKNRTSIVIAHRLSTIAKLDRIIVLNQGKIVEDGTHSELLKQNGTYAKLWNHQSGGFIEE
jgi:ATP-binding cassette subfamily B protein